ncbi:MAG: flavodoxin family protein [Thermoproteota archaeon]
MRYKVLGVCGSPRLKGNTEFLLETALDEFENISFNKEEILLREHEVKPCISCQWCIDNNRCRIDDDMTNKIIPKLIISDVIIIASPVYFNNVSGQIKTFMDRTWCIRGKLKNKIGGGIVVGRGYGLEFALTAIHSFMLKHEMILGHRGVSGAAYEKEKIKTNKNAIKDAKELADRLSELAFIIHPLNRLTPVHQ